MGGDGSGGDTASGGDTGGGGDKATGGDTSGDGGNAGTGGSTMDEGGTRTATVAAGTVAHSENFTAVLTLGEAPGGNRVMSSSKYRVNLGVIGANER